MNTQTISLTPETPVLPLPVVKPAKLNSKPPRIRSIDPARGIVIVDAPDSLPTDTVPKLHCAGMSAKGHNQGGMIFYQFPCPDRLPDLPQCYRW